MNRTHRTSLVRPRAALAAATLAVLALTACGGEAEEPTTASPADSPSAASSEPPSASPSTSTKPTPKRTKPTRAGEAGASAEVTIEGGSVEPLAQSLEAEVGDLVTLQITSDRAGELHVHSTPEQYHEFGPGRSTVELRFDKPGAVDVEEHESGALILRVLVR